MRGNVKIALRHAGAAAICAIILTSTAAAQQNCPTQNDQSVIVPVGRPVAFRLLVNDLGEGVVSIFQYPAAASSNKPAPRRSISSSSRTRLSRHDGLHLPPHPTRRLSAQRRARPRHSRQWKRRQPRRRKRNHRLRCRRSARSARPLRPHRRRSHLKCMWCRNRPDGNGRGPGHAARQAPLRKKVAPLPTQDQHSTEMDWCFCESPRDGPCVAVLPGARALAFAV